LPFEFLQAWYYARCDGSWEHGKGVTIETLDTPGWLVSIDLAGTALETRPMAPIRIEHSPSDWMICEVERQKFLGQGDAQKLGAILQVFKYWASSD
jgi:immunity protein 53 of polymorphic toxin system